MAEDVEERAEDEEGTLGSERVVSFSDGVFAIAITLLVLGLEVPDVADDQLGHALSQLGAQAVSYFIGFAVMGLFWIDHHHFVARLRAFDGRLLVLNLAYLSLVALMPFTTGVYGRYADVSIAVALYAGNVAATSLMSVAMRVYAEHRQLFLPEHQPRPLWRSLLPAAIFLASIPIAFVSPRAAPYVWLALLATSFARRAGARVT